MNYNPEKGQRWEDEDSRHADRVVRVIRTAGRFARVRVEVSSLNPKTIGRTRWMLKRTLRERYRLVSH